MKHKIIIAVVAFFSCLLPALVLAQTEFEVPKDYILKEKEDYAKYEKDIVAAAKWLEETDLGKEKGKRADVNHFVKEWLEGSPTVYMIYSAPLFKLFEKNEQLLYVYIASYCRWVIEHNNDDANKKGAVTAGLKSIMAVYKKGIEIKKNKDMLKLIDKDEKGGLDEYIDDKFGDLLKRK